MRTRTVADAVADAVAVAVAIVISMMWSGCSVGTLLGSEVAAGSPGEATDWTVLVILCGDNDLEAEALSDINEMEAVDLSGTGIRVLAMLDRAVGYDNSDGDWTGTRLFSIVHDPRGVNGEIVSVALSCPPLGVEPSQDIEVDLSDGSTISELLDYTALRYPSERRAVVVSGQSSGWRSVAYDQSSDDNLYTPELAAALAGRADVVALDASFGATIELAYELRQSRTVLIASQDQVDRQGWQYDNFLSRLAAGDGSVGSFVDSAMRAYEAEYTGYPSATVSAIDVREIDGVATALDELAWRVTAASSNSSVRDTYRDAFFYDTEDFYATPGDLSVDLYDLADIVQYVAEGMATPDVVAAADDLRAAVSRAVLHSWSGSANPRAHGLSIHLIPLMANGVAAVSHDDAYIQGRPVTYPLEFVTDSAWAPNLTGGSGFLYHLFYAAL